MAVKDLHNEPFDETTITKLEIFEDYTQAWLPTFIMQSAPTICIFDFFAGTGFDKNGVAGSPIRILKKIHEQIGHIFQKKTKVRIFFNEFEPNKRDQKKFKLLEAACDEFFEQNSDVKRAIPKPEFFNEDFETLFPKLLPEIRKHSSLLFLDQNGIKFLSDKYLLELEKIKQTDFLYFVSSSYFWRFGDSKEFKEHLDIDMDSAKKDPYKFVHRSILSQLRSRLPKSSELELYPFSLRKGSNIHGIIFGATHPRAVDKFLKIVWAKNESNGEANFDINDDSETPQLSIWKKQTKIEKFQDDVRQAVLAGTLRTNKEVLDFCYGQGHLGSHAAVVLSKLKKGNAIDFDAAKPLVNYDQVYKTGRILKYKIRK